MALTAAGCSGNAAPVPIWCGHVATTSGTDKHAGEAATRGIRLAVEEINKNLEHSGGRPLKVIHSDARRSLEAFEAEAVRLVSVNRVAFLLGGNSLEEVERLDRAGVPVITPLGAPAKTTSEAVYWTGPKPFLRGKVLAQLAVMELGLPAVAVVHDTHHEEAAEVADAFAREFAAAWEKKDAKVVPIVRRVLLAKDAKTDDLSQALQKAVAQDSLKALVFAGPAQLLDKLSPLGIPVLFDAAPISGSPLTIPRIPEQALYYITPFVVQDQKDAPQAAEFAKRFKQAFGDEANCHAALAYEGTKLLHEAISRSKDNLTVVRVKEELGKLKDFPGLAGTLSFTPERQLQRPMFVVCIDDTGTKTVKRYVHQD